MREELQELNMMQEEMNAETGGMTSEELQGYVGAMIDGDLFSLGLLGRHVQRRADNVAGEGE